MVQIKNLKKKLGNLAWQLSVADFDIKSSEFVSILGPSGCGKTTFLRILAGLESDFNGNIFLRGKDVSNFVPQKRPFHTVFQSYALFPHLNVSENIGFGLKVKKVAEKEIRIRVDQILDQMNLNEYSHAFIQTLSGGQQQRVALARALINKPDLVLLDEPLSALDSHLRFQMQIELRKIQKQFGVSFLMVTHDNTEAMFLSDRVAVMNQGSIVQYDEPAKVYRNPKNEQVMRALGDVLEIKIENKTHFLRPEAIQIIDASDTRQDLNGGTKIFGFKCKIESFQYCGEKTICNLKSNDHRVEIRKNPISLSINFNDLKNLIEKDAIFQFSLHELMNFEGPH